MNINFLKLVFAFMASVIVIFGNLVNFLENHLPPFIVQSFRYGKFSSSGRSALHVEVPKRWFKHFYVFATIYSFVCLHIAFSFYILHESLPKGTIAYLDLCAGSQRKTSIEPIVVIIALVLISLQSVRRFYETWFVSVFSDGKMNLSHYLIGFTHYWGAVTVIISEAKGFGSTDVVPEIRFTNITFLQLCAILLFFFAWHCQYQCAVILANTRKNAKGEITTNAHKIPRGGPFEFLSSPHLTCEVLIYLSLMLLLRQSDTFPYVFVWVLCNQMETAFLNHWWYKKTFKNYPKAKKAFIPFVL